MALREPQTVEQPAPPEPQQGGSSVASALFGRGGMLRRPVSAVSWGLVAVFLLMALFAPLIAPYDPIARGVGEPLLLPFSDGHLMGTDSFGRDQF
ncbi:MAG TPA: hypothetical protein VGV91_00095 [Rubrobacter sp.]|nr:hypothetical protein [Rubrobacter sp.]